MFMLQTKKLRALPASKRPHADLIPIINNSPNSAAPAYAIDEKNLFNYNDAADLAEKIDYWLDHPKERNERSLEYLDFTKKYSLAESMSAMEKMFKLVIYKQ